MATIKILIPLVNGFEETEYVAVRDILIRSGFDVDSVSLTGDKIMLANHNLKIHADFLYKDVKNGLYEYDVLYIPGGILGVRGLDKSLEFDAIVNDFASRNAIIGALCAAPSLLAKRGLLKGKEAVVFPDKKFIKELTSNGAIFLPDEKFAETDNKIFTGDTMTSSIEFGDVFSEYIKKTL